MWLREIARASADAKVCMDIVGHTSRTGSVAFNDTLSVQRARYIRQRLVGEVGRCWATAPRQRQGLSREHHRQRHRRRGRCAGPPGRVQDRGLRLTPPKRLAPPLKGATSAGRQSGSAMYLISAGAPERCRFLSSLTLRRFGGRQRCAAEADRMPPAAGRAHGRCAPGFHPVARPACRCGRASPVRPWPCRPSPAHRRWRRGRRWNAAPRFWQKAPVRQTIMASSFFQGIRTTAATPGARPGTRSRRC